MDDLPPPSRFAARALARGLTPDDLAAMLRCDRTTVVRHLRSAARGLGLDVPATSSDDAALTAALAPLLDAARNAPLRPPATRCPGDDVLAAMAHGGLDGALLLAEVEHAADCAPCLDALVGRRAGPPPGAAVPPAPGGAAALWLGALAGAAVAAAYLLWG